MPNLNAATETTFLGDFVEVVHDPEVRALIDSGEFYRVTEDHWNEDYTIRTIIKAEVDRDAD